MPMSGLVPNSGSGMLSREARFNSMCEIVTSANCQVSGDALYLFM